MAVLTIEQSTAKMLYKHVPSWFQRTLEEAFGKENVIESIMDKVKTYQDAVAFADAATLQECSIYPTDTHDIVVYKKLKLIARVLNEGCYPTGIIPNNISIIPISRCPAVSIFRSRIAALRVRARMSALAFASIQGIWPFMPGSNSPSCISIF